MIRRFFFPHFYNFLLRWLWKLRCISFSMLIFVSIFIEMMRVSVWFSHGRREGGNIYSIILSQLLIIMNFIIFLDIFIEVQLAFKSIPACYSSGQGLLFIFFLLFLFFIVFDLFGKFAQFFVIQFLHLILADSSMSTIKGYCPDFKNEPSLFS